ncbi:MAG: DNA repair protein RadA [Acidimicrobiales bacterium]
MSRPRTLHRCRSCGTVTARWAGRCPSCGEWNALVEERAVPIAPRRPGCAVPEGVAVLRPWRVDAEGAGPGSAPALVALDDVDLCAAVPFPTGIGELDRVLGGGLVPGSVTLLGGEPGVGKSTLLLQVLRARAAAGAPVVLVCAEESPQQVRVRAERLGPLPDNLFLLPGTDATSIPEQASRVGASLVVVDSIQAVRDAAASGAAGSVSQVRACAELLVDMAKSGNVPVVLVGHVTKDGALAGPRLLEHVVDTVLSVEGDRHHALRTVRAVKHRFGPTGELGLFEMGESGLAAVDDPYRLLLGDRRPGQRGSSVLPAVQGQRALLVEVQALLGPAAASTPAAPARRQAQGLDHGRVALLLAVLDSSLALRLGSRDVFTSVVGGIKVSEPAADLAVAMALCSAHGRLELPPDLVCFGEVGLGGEIRQVPHAPRRLAEAHRLGFRRALVPMSCPDGPVGLTLLRAGRVADAVARIAA